MSSSLSAAGHTSFGEQNFSFRQAAIYFFTGIGVGLLSGLFGVGGGLIATPILLYILKFKHREAVSTSLLAIFFPVCAGAATFFWHGYYSFSLALVLAIGSLVGVQLGTYMLQIVSIRTVEICFIGLIAFLCTCLLIVIPSRNISFTLSFSSGVIVFLIALLAGLMAGLLGIGGGGIVIPLLILFFGMSDLVAKGSALLMMIITSSSGTISNLRYGSLNYRAAIIIGITAMFFAPLGGFIATLVSPLVSNILFVLFLVAVVSQVLFNLRSRR